MQEQASTADHSGEPISPEPLNRVVVRFPTLRRKPPPSGFLNMDQAIDCIGAAKFPAEWGIGDAWKAQPFRQDPSSKRFVRHQLVRRKRSFCVATCNLVSTLAKSDLKNCHWIFYSVRRELANALTEKEIAASKFFVDGNIEPFTANQRGVWLSQMRAIFYTGYGHEVREGRDCKYRVLIDQRSLVAWLRGRSTGTQATKPPSATSLRILADTLVARAVVHDYRLMRGHLFKVVKEALEEVGFALPERRFNREVWGQPAFDKFRSMRRPSPQAVKRFEADVPEIKALIREQFQWR